MKIRAARSGDLDAIRTFLAEHELPSSDVDTSVLTGFLVAEDATGAMIGTVGLDQFGIHALVRSLAVARHHRNRGLGAELLSRVESVARAAGTTDVWLLTTTAAGYFPKARYERVNRISAPNDLQSSSQFADLCPTTAVCMHKRL